jgi:hypothetical protein
MKLALLNTLSDGRGGGLNPDGLALDLQFAADKTLTARRGPTPVFTRGSGATQINAQGLIEWTPENLVASSENMSAFTRTEVVAPVSVSGGPTGSFSELAVTATGGFHFYRLPVNETTNTTAMMWVLAKRGTARYLRMGGGPASSFDWDTLSWSVTNPAHQTIAPVSHPFGDGWYWLPIFRVSNSGLVDLTPSSTSGTTFSFYQPSVETVLVAAVQLSRSNLPQTGAINYYKTTGTSFYAPRFDHDPVTLACRGLLIEEGRTNLLLQSETFGTTWTASQLNTTGTPAYINVATAPDGTTTAEKLIAHTATTTHQFRQSVTLVSGTTYTVSNYFKAAEQKFVLFQLFGVANGSNDWLAFFDVSTATPTAGAFNGFTSISITNAGNGWFRCTGTFTATASGTLEVRIGGAGSLSFGGQFYTGDGTSGILVWGAQLEAGSFPTSYIPTTTGSVVRSADVCSIAGGDFTSFYNQSEGTMLTNAFTPASGDRTVLAADDNTANEMIRLRTEGTNPFFKVTDGGSELVAIDAGTVSANTSFKLIGAYKLDDFASSINGGAAVTDTSGTTPTVDRMRIGAGQGGNTMCGCVASLRFYKKRLPNAKLQSLTA